LAKTRLLGLEELHLGLAELGDDLFDREPLPGH
jgi:hypothetical protein